MAEQIAAQLDTRVFQSKIRGSVSVAESPAHGVSVLDYAPRSKPSLDFEALCEEIAAVHGGSLRFESVLGEGTTVIVELRGGAV